MSKNMLKHQAVASVYETLAAVAKARTYLEAVELGETVSEAKYFLFLASEDLNQALALIQKPTN